MPKARRITVVDESGTVIKEYKSSSACAKDYKITRYKLDGYIANNTLYNGVYFLSEEKPSDYVDVVCASCGKTFRCESFRVERSDNVYCSIECRDKALEGELNCKCPVCGKMFHVKPRIIKINKNVYCSRECHRIAKKEYMQGENNHQYGLKGELNASWKSNEKISTYGYRMIRSLDHPFKDSSDMVLEHRLVAEQYLLNDENSVEIDGKRYLRKEYVVHHINYNKLDNRVENLEVMLLKDHQALHGAIEGNFFEFEEYCKKHGIDFEETYRQHLLNIKLYKR